MITRLTKHFYARAAMMLAVMLMTMTAWAQTVSFPTESGGDGTVDNPYKITTADDLNKLAADVNSGLDTDLTLIPWTGSGTETDPYVIKYTSQLDQLADSVNNGNDYKDTYFQLGADLTYDHTTAWDDTTSIYPHRLLQWIFYCLGPPVPWSFRRQ